jgi:hypothetical protein
MNEKIDTTFFAGHESFYLREGWLKKSLDIVEGKPYIFQGKYLKEAINSLGVGANMVKSMRYWLELCGLICKKKDCYELTEIAILLRSHDPYFQHLSSLWIIHSLVAENSPLWRFIFIEQDLPVFDRLSVHDRVDSRLKEIGKKFAKKTINDSISVFINTYLADKASNDPENNIISPFSKLKIMNHFDNKFVFRTIDHSEFSPYLIYFLYLSDKSVEQIAQREIYDKLRKIMRIESNSLRKVLDYLENQGVIRIDRAAGLNNIIKIKQFTREKVFKKMLKDIVL